MIGGENFSAPACKGDITDNISVLIVRKNDVVVIGNINAVIVQNDKGFERESDLTSKRACVCLLYTSEYSFAFLLMGINVAGSYFLQAILKTKEALFISLLRGFVFSGLLMFALPAAFGFSAIWWAMPLSELLTLAVTLPFRKKSMGRGPAVSAEQPV